MIKQAGSFRTIFYTRHNNEGGHINIWGDCYGDRIFKGRGDNRDKRAARSGSGSNNFTKRKRDVPYRDGRRR